MSSPCSRYNKSVRQRWGTNVSCSTRSNHLVLLGLTQQATIISCLFSYTSMSAGACMCETMCSAMTSGTALGWRQQGPAGGGRETATSPGCQPAEHTRADTQIETAPHVAPCKWIKKEIFSRRILSAVKAIYFIRSGSLARWFGSAQPASE